MYPPLVNQPPRARGVEDLQRLFLCVKPSSYMYRQTYQKQGLILESYRILRWTNVQSAFLIYLITDAVITLASGDVSQGVNVTTPIVSRAGYIFSQLQMYS